MIAADQPLDPLRYPIGKASIKAELDAREREQLIDTIAQLPARLRDAVAGMPDAMLDTPYRPGGWTARQVVHHIPDSHLNAYVRFKLALTEAEPTIRVYQEAEWARLADSAGPIAVSLDLLTALHARWTGLMRTVDDAGWRRTFMHPDSGRNTLDRMLQVYAWHGEHHLAHIRAVRERAGKGTSR
jgi:hypothetical protein